jgi:hypothetical protein
MKNLFPISHTTQTSSSSSRRNQLIRIVDELVDSASTPHEQICPRCGKKTSSVAATLTLYGSKVQWQIRLPFCACALAPTLH